MRLKTLFLILTIVITFSGCSSLKKVVEPPKVELQDVRITNLSFSNLDLDVVLEVENPNNIDFDVKNLKYTLDINSKTVTTGSYKEKVLVKSKTKTLVSLPLKLAYKDILDSAVLFIKKEGMPYKIQGSAEIGPFTIPFNDTGTLKSSDL